METRPVIQLYSLKHLYAGMSLKNHVFLLVCVLSVMISRIFALVNIINYHQGNAYTLP